MTKLLEQAITAVRGLAPADQDEIAQAMLSLAGRDDREEIDPEHLDDVLAGLAEADRGEFATDQEVREAFDRFGR